MLRKPFRSISLHILHQHIYDLYVSMQIWIGTRWPESAPKLSERLPHFILLIDYFKLSIWWSCSVYWNFTCSLWTFLRIWADVVQLIMSMQKLPNGQDRWSCGLVLSCVLSWKCPATDLKERWHVLYMASKEHMAGVQDSFIGISHSPWTANLGSVWDKAPINLYFTSLWWIVPLWTHSITC